MKLLTRSLSGRKGKENTCQVEKTSASKGAKVKPENVLRKSNVVLPGRHRLQRCSHTPAVADLWGLLLDSPRLLHEQATLAGCWGRH